MKEAISQTVYQRLYGLLDPIIDHASDDEHIYIRISVEQNDVRVLDGYVNIEDGKVD